MNERETETEREELQERKVASVVLLIEQRVSSALTVDGCGGANITDGITPTTAATGTVTATATAATTTVD